MRNLSTIIAVLFATACQAQPDAALSDFQLQGLQEAAAHTPYLAKVKHLGVIKERAFDSATEQEYERHIYSAEVLATYRGAPASEISYAVITEKGEDALLDTAPVILALCVDKQGQLYWPGTGAQFAASSKNEQWLKQNRTVLRQQPSDNSWCDN